MTVRLVALLLLAVLAGPVRAQVPVDLALVLALDSSASVDTEEFGLQRGGLAAAFRDPEVIDAIAKGPLQRIAVVVMEWAGEAQQRVAVEWTLVEGAASALAFADRIDSFERRIPTGATSIAGALSFGNALLRTAPLESSRRVIDLSGDGRNNQGAKVEVVRQAVVAHGVTVNGLAILNEHPTLDFYFQDRVIGGAGAFVEVANDYADYARTIRRKLIREISNLTISQGPAATSMPEFGVQIAQVETGVR